jgi:hypothetical protein
MTKPTPRQDVLRTSTQDSPGHYTRQLNTAPLTCCGYRSTFPLILFVLLVLDDRALWSSWLQVGYKKPLVYCRFDRSTLLLSRR